MTAALGCALLIAQFFLPLFEVDSGDMRRVGDLVATKSETESEDGALAADFAAVFRTVSISAEVSPADLVHYARTAGRQNRNLRRPTSAGPKPTIDKRTSFERILLLVWILALAPPLGSVILLAYVLYHRLKRFRSPMLIFALLLGAVGVAFPAAHQHARHALMPQIAPGIGMWAALAGGSTVFLSGIFGVRVANWWHVYLGGAAMLFCLAVIGAAWIQGAFPG